MNNRCGTCRHWQRDEDSIYGDCRFIDAPALMPEAWHLHRIAENYGTNCPCWEERK